MPGEEFPCHRRRYTSCTPGQKLDPELRLQILNAFRGGRKGDIAILRSTRDASTFDSSEKDLQGCPIRQFQWPTLGDTLFRAGATAGSQSSLA
jgi:hypothetical protein